MWKGGGKWGKSSWGDQASAYGKGGWGEPAKGKQWGIQGLNEVLAEALVPIADEEPEMGDLIRKISKKVEKPCDRFSKDDRAAAKLSSTAAKALVEELVEQLMGCISGVCYERTWFSKVTWTQPLLTMVLHTFQTAKIFTRTLKPQIVKHIQDGVFKWTEDERCTKVMAGAMVLSGVKDEYMKKAIQHLTKAYDDAHFRAPYGSSQNGTPQVAQLEDFVKGWMTEFHIRAAWDVFTDGLPDNSQEKQIVYLSVLFQNLLDPGVACMPADIATDVANALGGLPSSPWAYINECAAAVIFEQENAAAPGQSAKRRKF